MTGRLAPVQSLHVPQKSSQLHWGEEGNTTHLTHSYTDLLAAPSETAFSWLGILLVYHSPYRPPMAGCMGLHAAHQEEGAGTHVEVHLAH